MLYRGRRVAVVGLAADAPEEAEYLRQIGCEVEYFDAKRARKYEIRGAERVSAPAGGRSGVSGGLRVRPAAGRGPGRAAPGAGRRTAAR